MKETPKVRKIALPVQDVAHGLIRNLMTRVSQRAGNAIVTQLEFSRAKRTTSSSTRLKSKVGQDRYGSRLATLNIGSQPSIDTATARYEFAKTRHRDVKPLDDASATGVPATNVDNDTKLAHVPT